MSTKRRSTRKAPAPSTAGTPMEQQRELATRADRFLPQNLPEEKFRELLRLVWLWRMPPRDSEIDVDPLVDYIRDTVQARLTVDPGCRYDPTARSLLGPIVDGQLWVETLMWVGAALTAEWGHREGFVGPPRFDLDNFDFESQQEWGAPRVPGAMAVSAAPNNPFVAQLAEAMDAVFNPEKTATECAFCDRNEQFRDLAAITDAIAAADQFIGYQPSPKELPPPWRLSGALAALALSKHYSEGTDPIREHCYHVAHGAVNSAQHLFARDQKVKECGPGATPWRRSRIP